MSTTNRAHFILFLCGLMVHVFSHASAQIDTTGFPLSVGNKWYYRYVNRSNPSAMVLIKTIADTMADGTRMVRTTRLGEDSVTLATETWRVSSMGFHLNTILLYHSFLMHDSSWNLVYLNSFDRGTILLRRTSLFGIDFSSQIRSRNGGSFSGPESWTEHRVALGIGLYYDHSHGYGGSSSWNYTYELVGVRIGGVLFGDTTVTSFDDHWANLPLTFSLGQNHPNPFNPSTSIKFQIPNTNHVTLKVFDLLGREVTTLVDDEMQAGNYEKVFHAEGLASGVYVYQLRSGNSVQTKRLLLLR